MPDNPEIFQPMTNLTWTCGKCGRLCSVAFLDCAGCAAADESAKDWRVCGCGRPYYRTETVTDECASCYELRLGVI